MFNKEKDRILNYLQGKDWTPLNDIIIAADMSKTRTRSFLFRLKYKNILETDNNDNWKLTSIPPVVEEEVQEIETPANSTRKSPEVQTPDDDTPIPDMQEKGINAKMSDIEHKLDLVLGVKQKKTRFGKLRKLNIRKLRAFNKKKNRACIMLRRNQGIELVKGEYINGMIRVDDNYYDGGALYTWLWLGKQPLYVIPEWSTRPLAAEEVYKKAVEEGNLIDSQILTIQAMKQVEAELDDVGKKKPNIMMWLGIGGALLVGIWLFMGIGK